jgi:hypothetical protein
MRIHINKWWMLKDASISFASVSLKRVREEKAENDNFALDGLDGCCFGALSKMELTEKQPDTVDDQNFFSGRINKRVRAFVLFFTLFTAFHCCAFNREMFHTIKADRIQLLTSSNGSR